MDYSPWGHKELYMTEPLSVYTHTHTHTHTHRAHRNQATGLMTQTGLMIDFRKECEYCSGNT